MKKSCFIIGPIGSAESDIRNWSDEVLDYIVAPVVKELGYSKPVRADKISGVPSISFAIMTHLVNDDLVIADLTSGNPNAFYELAIRHALKKPVVHIIRDGEKIPFDVHDVQVVYVSTEGLRKADKARSTLKSQITAVEDNEFIIPYIERIQQLKSLFDSTRPNEEKEELLNLLERLENIQFGVNELKTDMGTLIRQLIYNKNEEPAASTFREQRLKKAELVRNKRQQ